MAVKKDKKTVQIWMGMEVRVDLGGTQVLNTHTHTHIKDVNAGILPLHLLLPN